MPGMPATGLGGIFYALLMLWVLLRETFAAARGGRDRQRWRHILVLALYIGGILAAFWMAAQAIFWLAGPLLSTPGATFASQVRAIDALVPNIALVPFILLALLLILLQALRIVLIVQARRLADARVHHLVASAPVASDGAGAGTVDGLAERH